MERELPAIPEDAALLQLAQKLFWWKAPQEALADPTRFAAQVMTYGNWEDVQLLRARCGEELFRRTLREAPPGVFDEPSWAYWHHVFGFEPVPDMPRRELC